MTPGGRVTAGFKLGHKETDALADEFTDLVPMGQFSMVGL